MGNHNRKAMEVLAPAGSYDSLIAAVNAGADAVYCGGNRYGARAYAENFTEEQLLSAMDYAHLKGVRVYLTVNTCLKNRELEELPAYLMPYYRAGLDAVLVQDFGVLSLIREVFPDLPVHASTQMNITSAHGAAFLQSLGLQRVVLARELSLDEIIQIRKNTSPELELEVFIHGAMCVSYSGRCLLSNHFTGRDGNRGQCAQPCRWNYKLYKLEEGKDGSRQPGIEQTEDGTFIMSSADMCMIEHIPELCEANISSFKIEGRMKSVYYTAATALAYRQAVDSYLADKDNYVCSPEHIRILESVTHRKYDTGYFFDKPMENAKTVDEPGYITERPYFGIVSDYDDVSGFAKIVQKNKTVCGDTVRFLTPEGDKEPFRITELFDGEMQSIISTPHPKMEFYVKTPYKVGEGDILH